MTGPHIYTRLKIGLSLVVAFLAGKCAGASNPAHYSALFSIAFLFGAIATQGAFKIWETRRRSH